MQRQIKSYSSPFKLIIPIITLVLTAHIPPTSLARSRYFSTFSSSLALTLPSSGIVTIMLWQLSSFCRCSPSLLTSLPWYVPSRKSHNSLYLHFQAHFLEHGHTTSHFAHTHIFLKGPNERPQPHCHVSFCIIFVCVSSAHQTIICLIVLLLCLHNIIVTSSFPCFILSYFFTGLSEAPCKKQYSTQDFNGKKNYHYECIVGLNHSYRGSRLHSLIHETTLTRYSVMFFFAKNHGQL